MTEQKINEQYKRCIDELNAVEKKIQESNEQILDIEMKQVRSFAEQKKLQFLRSALPKLEKDKEFWKEELSKASYSNKRQKLEWQSSELEALEFEPGNPLFELDANYLAGAGLPVSNKLVLYCRPLFHEQFEFLRKTVCEDSYFGWILGPPGTGKSTTALAFASTLVRTEWIVTWIHLSRRYLPVCVRYEGNQKKSLKIPQEGDNDVKHLLECDQGNKKHIVFLDGFLANKQSHEAFMDAVASWRELDEENRRAVVICSMSSPFMDAVASWRELDEENRRAVVICSMSSRGENNDAEDALHNVKEFFVYSWELEEYIEAVQHEDFFNNVRDKLDAGFDAEETSDATASLAQGSSSAIVSIDRRRALIESKFYYAGGSCRYMFDFDTATVMEKLSTAIEKVDDIVPYIKRSIGPQSNHIVNRLICVVRSRRGLGRLSTFKYIVSEWAASLLAIINGPDLVKSLAEVARRESNPSMDGWLLEMWFFAQIRNSDLTLLESTDTQVQWAKCPVEELTSISVISNEPIWLKPVKWNQGGYDAIFIDKRAKYIRFVQVTRGKEHSLKLQYFASFLNELAKSAQSFEIDKLDIVFIVLREKIADFKVSKITGSGLLKQFGFEQGNEREKLKVLGIEDWNH
ncbi:hypothetical protein MP638_002729 [Amoeboaphelidium occidentale]|nr:hypothetical protein MP638_002729 [Amoeboaphelidium occidentale]